MAEKELFSHVQRLNVQIVREEGSFLSRKGVGYNKNQKYQIIMLNIGCYNLSYINWIKNVLNYPAFCLPYALKGLLGFAF